MILIIYKDFETMIAKISVKDIPIPSLKKQKIAKGWSFSISKLIVNKKLKIKSVT